MKSHTVPCKLLEQFSYLDTRTKSLRLWRYEKNLQPYPKASPRTATRIDGHFNHPDIAAKEEELESRLNREIEMPVNQFLFQIRGQSFVRTDERRRQLTRYLTLLFNRSNARREASQHFQHVTVGAVNTFLSNERQVLTVAAKCSIDLLLSGKIQRGLVTAEIVCDAARSLLRNYETERSRQARYAESIERAMSYFDEAVYSGEWRYLKTSPRDPFILSDAPVVTWERLDDPDALSYGIGFQRPKCRSIAAHLLHRVPARFARCGANSISTKANREGG